MARNFREQSATDLVNTERRPDWLKVRLPHGEHYAQLKGLLRAQSLHTVCEEAHCPNMGECWENLTATYMILGNICTRSCAFCAVTTGRPTELDLLEPERVAQAAKAVGLKHVVVTSVDRDDLKDGGADIFARTIAALRSELPECGIEVLTPDFKGDRDAISTVVRAHPDIFNHNVETVPRLYRTVRPQAKYRRSLDLLRQSKEEDDSIYTKSGVMVGLGETWDEIIAVLADLRDVGVDIVTIGQYLRPSKDHHPLLRYYTPAEFAEFKRLGLEMGFRHVESGPLVRSSYHAHEQLPPKKPRTLDSDNAH